MFMNGWFHISRAEEFNRILCERPGEWKLFLF